MGAGCAAGSEARAPEGVIAYPLGNGAFNRNRYPAWTSNKQDDALAGFCERFPAFTTASGHHSHTHPHSHSPTHPLTLTMSSHRTV